MIVPYLLLKVLNDIFTVKHATVAFITISQDNCSKIDEPEKSNFL